MQSLLNNNPVERASAWEALALPFMGKRSRESSAGSTDALQARAPHHGPQQTSLQAPPQTSLSPHLAQLSRKHYIERYTACYPDDEHTVTLAVPPMVTSSAARTVTQQAT